MCIKVQIYGIKKMLTSFSSESNFDLVTALNLATLVFYISVKIIPDKWPR